MPVYLDITKSLFYQREQKVRKKAKAEGIAEGRVSGIAKTKIEDATNLIKEGVDLSIIHRSIGLSMKELIQLQKKIT